MASYPRKEPIELFFVSFKNELLEQIKLVGAESAPRLEGSMLPTRAESGARKTYPPLEEKGGVM